MLEDVLKGHIEELARDCAQRDNAINLLMALEGTVLAGVDHEDIELNRFTNAICINWNASGEWDNVFIEVYRDGFETCLSRDRELRIKHWPKEPKSAVIKIVVRELVAGMA